jgi:hypothetical protein
MWRSDRALGQSQWSCVWFRWVNYQIRVWWVWFLFEEIINGSIFVQMIFMRNIDIDDYITRARMDGLGGKLNLEGVGHGR